MHCNNGKLLVLAVMAGLISVLPFSSAYAATAIANEVADLTTVTVYTVPTLHTAKVTSVIISNEGANTVYDQRLEKSGIPDLPALLPYRQTAPYRCNSAPQSPLRQQRQFR